MRGGEVGRALLACIVAAWLDEGIACEESCAHVVRRLRGRQDIVEEVQFVCESAAVAQQDAV